MTEIIFLCFHYLKRSDEYGRIYGNDFSDFKKYIEYLQNNFPIIDFEDFKLFLQGKKKLPPKCSVISFDDGLAEHAKIIAPYLKEKNISALFCFPTCILRKEMAGVQIIHFMTARYGVRKFFKLLKKYFSTSDLLWDVYFDGTEDNLKILPLYSKIKEVLMKKIPGDKSRLILKTMYQEVLLKDDPKVFDKIYFSTKDVQRMLRMGHRIACHTDTHPFFMGLDIDDAEAWYREVVEPRLVLSEHAKYNVDIFAYPFGGDAKDFDFHKWTGKLKKAGFTYALNAYRDSKKQEQFDPFWIQRYSVQSKDVVENLKNNSCHYFIEINN